MTGPSGAWLSILRRKCPWNGSRRLPRASPQRPPKIVFLQIIFNIMGQKNSNMSISFPIYSKVPLPRKGQILLKVLKYNGQSKRDKPTAVQVLSCHKQILFKSHSYSVPKETAKMFVFEYCLGQQKLLMVNCASFETIKLYEPQAIPLGGNRQNRLFNLGFTSWGKNPSFFSALAFLGSTGNLASPCIQ